MSSRESDNSQLRDPLLAKLMAESLASSSTAQGESCPDAETVAAYAERNLSPEESARLDVHFADCAGCQTVLAALARSLDSLPASGAAESLADSPWPTLANIPPQTIARSAKLSVSAGNAAQSSAPASKIRPVIKPVIRNVPPPQPTRWSELAPALGIAAAIALWFALRPAPPTQNLSAQLRTDTETSATQLPTARAPASSDKDIANPDIAGADIAAANAPSPATLARPAPASPSPQSSADALANDASRGDALKKYAPAEEAANAPATALGGTSAGIASRKELQASQAPPAASTQPASVPNAGTVQGFSTGTSAGLAPAAPKSIPSPSGAGGVASSASVAGVAERAKPAVAINKLTSPSTVTITGDLPAVNTVNAQLGGTLEQSSVGELPVAPRNYVYLLPTPPGQPGTNRDLRAASAAPFSRDEAAAKSSGLATESGAVPAVAARPLVLTRVSTPTFAFAAPSGDAAWRIGAAGSIERSYDRGRTWQRQSSGVTGDLLAGAAASDETAWVVGRGGIILRTTDGKTWQRVSLPVSTANAPLDLTAVQTSGALRATVTATSGRRFTTSDGGQTWSSQ